jgi:hypothetical protein
MKIPEYTIERLRKILKKCPKKMRCPKPKDSVRKRLYLKPSVKKLVAQATKKLKVPEQELINAILWHDLKRDGWLPK